jgi:Raf kinase inhibitor-like YbhB/YbcL family protein
MKQLGCYLLAAATGMVSLSCKGKETEPAIKLELTSPAFADGETIPKEYTADGANRSPSLSWSSSAPPPGTQSFVVICGDPDAPGKTWVHWVVFDLQPNLRGLDGGLPTDAVLSSGAKQGANDFGKLGYGGPDPPPGKPHRYVFTLYAVDTMLDLAPGATKDAVSAAMKGHVLAEGKLVGRYGR